MCLSYAFIKYFFSYTEMAKKYNQIIISIIHHENSSMTGSIKTENFMFFSFFLKMNAWSFTIFFLILNKLKKRCNNKLIRCSITQYQIESNLGLSWMKTWKLHVYATLRIIKFSILLFDVFFMYFSISPAYYGSTSMEIGK